MPRATRAREQQGGGRLPIYTAPQVFLDLEKDYKKQARQLKREKRIEEEEEEFDDVDQLASDQDDSGYLSSSHNRKKKKQKGKQQETRKNSKKKKEKEVEGPSPFDNLPNELLHRIFSLIDHRSLFYVSLLSNRFHALLHSRDAAIRKIWKNARGRVEEELPVVSDMKEKELAKLLYGKTCFFCQEEEGEGDPWMRIILCRACRKENLVCVSRVSVEYPEVMPRAVECCMSTFISASGKHTKSRWVFESALNDESSELLELEQQDLDEGESDIWEEIRGNGKYCFDFDEKVPKVGTGKRVVKYVEERKSQLKEWEKEGTALWEWLEQEREEAENVKEEAKNIRRRAIEERLLKLDEYSEDDFDDLWKKTTLVTEGPSEINDKEWKKLEPKIVKVVEHCRKLKEKGQGHAHFEARLEHLRTAIYNPLLEKLASLGEVDPSTYPLFADFCNLPAVLALLDLEDTTTDKIARREWLKVKDRVDEEAEDWYDQVRLQAIRLALSRRRDPPTQKQFDDDEYVDRYDAEKYLERIEFFVCCNVSGCQSTSKERQVFFGSIYDVLKHQHEAHSDLVPKFTKAKKNLNMSLRFSLPIPVASAVAQILELGGLDEKKTKENDVDALFEEGRGKKPTTLQWIDKPRVGKGKSKKETSWKKIISNIKIESDRADKKKQKLKPTLKFFNLRKLKGKEVAPPSDSEEEEEEEEEEGEESESDSSE